MRASSIKKVSSFKSPELKAYLDSGKIESKIIGPVQRHLLANPPENIRRRDVLHPSEIVKSDWCHRAAYFTLLGYEVPQKANGFRLESIFAEGNSIHRKWQGWLADMGVLYGTWYCPSCHTISWGMSNELCPKCNIRREYREVPVESDKHRIAGHADGWIIDGSSQYLIEIKSIGPGTIRTEAPEIMSTAGGDVQKAWKIVRRPFSTHIRQGQMYLELLQIMKSEGKIDTAPDEIVFIYELKADQDAKEFVIRRNPDRVEHIFEAAADIVYAVKVGRPPECNISKDGCAKCLPFEDQL